MTQLIITIHAPNERSLRVHTVKHELDDATPDEIQLAENVADLLRATWDMMETTRQGAMEAEG